MDLKTSDEVDVSSWLAIIKIFGSSIMPGEKHKLFKCQNEVKIAKRTELCIFGDMN